MIISKSEREIATMREAGRLVAQTLQMLRGVVVPGITTQELDHMAEQFIRSAGAIPAFKGYHGFPANICASLNEQVVHGIPGSRQLKDGDIISIDIGVLHDGYYGDAAITLPVGKVDPAVEQLLKVTEESLMKGIAQAVLGQRIGDISHAVQNYAESYGYGVVREYVGHGIGRHMHEDPQIPNYGLPGRGLRLKEGMTIAIEPMINMGTSDIRLLNDEWTVVTADGSLSAHFEHTVAITNGGPDILTLP
jgi:methionyl aminopeptidase